MDFKKNRVVMREAVNSGCKTMGELALYLRLIRQLRVGLALPNVIFRFKTKGGLAS